MQSGVRLLGIICLFAAFAASTPVAAQAIQKMQLESPILTIDSERLFEQSAYGRQTIEEIEAKGAKLSVENRAIEEELEAEEKELTELRPTIAPTEFRELADAFDEKVQEIRRTQDSKSRELAAELEERRVVFLNAAAPVLEQLMREAGAAVVIERRSVFISSKAVDITNIAIGRIDRALTETDAAAPEN